MKLQVFIILSLLVLCSALLGATVSSETGEELPGMIFPTPEDFNAPSQAEEPYRGVNSWTGTGPWGGNVRGLATDPTNNMRVFATCGSTLTNQEGGVYTSLDGGVNWQPTSLPRKQYNAVAASASQPGTFWIGSRTGLYKSTDYGTAWNLVGSSTNYVLGVGVHPSIGNIIVMGKSGGVGITVSTDGGNNFIPTNVTTGFMRQFAWSAADLTQMYVVMGSSTSSVLTSADGVTWTAVGPAGNGWGMYISPTNPLMMVLAHDSGVYRTTDGGANWTNTVGGTFRSIVEYNGILYATNNSTGMYESNDMGQTWTNYNVGVVQSTWQTGVTTGAGALFGHWGGIFRATQYLQPIVASHTGLNLALVHGLAYYADTNELWGGAEGSGLYCSTDNGATWTHKVNGLNNWMIYELQPTNHEYYLSGRMLAGTLDGAYTSTDGGNTWSFAHWSGAQISGCEVHPTNPDIYWLANSFGEVRATYDGGVTFTTATGGAWGTFPRLRLGRGPTGNLRLFLAFQGSATAIWYSDDLGASFVASSALGSTTYQPQMSIRPALGAQPQLIYASTNLGIYKSTDFGATYAPTGMTAFSWSVLSSPGSQVISGNGPGIMYSVDEAATQTNLMQNLETYATIWSVAWGVNTNQSFIAMRTRGVMENRFADIDYGLPTNLTGTPGHQQVLLNWTPVSTTPEPISYYIWRDGYPVGQVQGDQSSWTDTGLTNGQAYKYFVSAVYEDHTQTNAVQIISATPAAPTGQPPIAPINVNITIVGGYVQLDWDIVTTDIYGSPITVDNYNVFVGDLPGFECNDETFLTNTIDHSLITDFTADQLSRAFFRVTAVVD